MPKQQVRHPVLSFNSSSLWPLTVPPNGSCIFIQCLMKYASMVPWKAWPCGAQLWYQGGYEGGKLYR